MRGGGEYLVICHTCRKGRISVDFREVVADFAEHANEGHDVEIVAISSEGRENDS